MGKPIVSKFLKRKAQMVAAPPVTPPPPVEDFDEGDDDSHQAEVWVFSNSYDGAVDSFLEQVDILADRFGLKAAGIQTGGGEFINFFNSPNDERAELFAQEVKKLKRIYRGAYKDLQIRTSADFACSQESEDYDDVEGELYENAVKSGALKPGADTEALERAGISKKQGPRWIDIARKKLKTLVPQNREWSIVGAGIYLALKDAGLLPADHR